MTKRSDGGVWNWCMPLGMIAGTSILLLGLAMVPVRSGPVALVFPVWWSTNQVAEGAFRVGRLLRLGGPRFVAIVQPDADTTDLWRSGAWMMLNPRLLGGCLAAPR